jgi:hypothetical protein
MISAARRATRGFDGDDVLGTSVVAEGAGVDVARVLIDINPVVGGGEQDHQCGHAQKCEDLESLAREYPEIAASIPEMTFWKAPNYASIWKEAAFIMWELLDHHTIRDDFGSQEPLYRNALEGCRKTLVYAGRSNPQLLNDDLAESPYPRESSFFWRLEELAQTTRLSRRG